MQGGLFIAAPLSACFGIFAAWVDGMTTVYVKDGHPGRVFAVENIRCKMQCWLKSYPDELVLLYLVSTRSERVQPGDAKTLTALYSPRFPNRLNRNLGLSSSTPRHEVEDHMVLSSNLSIDS